MLPVAILAGGLATRMRPLTERVPKALLLVNDEPFISHQLRLLAAGGVEKVVMCLGFLGEMVEEFVGDGSRFQLSVSYSFDGPVLRGTAGAIQQALPFLGKEFFVLYGDSYLPCDYRAIAAAFQHNGKEALMTVFHNQGKFDASNVEYSGNQIRIYDKKNRTPRMEHIDYGLGAFRASAFDNLDPNQPSDLASLYQELLAREQLAGYEINRRFYEIGSTEGLQELSEFLAGRQTTQVSS